MFAKLKGLFRGKKPEAAPEKAGRKLTAAERREIRKVIEAARGDGKPHSAQDTLPFRQMYPDGLCRLDDTTWSRCIEFEDVNYQLAGQDDQTAIFEALCDMYNAHDSSIGMELTLVCRKVNRADFRKRIEIAAQGDPFDGVRALYTEMLRAQLEHGNNGMVKTKFLVLTIEAADIKTARARFSRIILDGLGHFKVMGALAKALDGREWLAVLHGVLHPDGERFSFEWDWLAPSGLHVKDFIVPSSFRFGEARRFRMGGKYGAASFLQITAPELNDRVLADLLDTDSSIFVSLHIRSLDQNEAIKTVKRKITDLDSMKIDAQKRAAREGFDIDIIPSDLATYAGEAKNILRDLQSRNERMFLLTFLVVNVADTRQKLENDILRASSVAQKHNCHLVRLDFQQEQGFVSALPLGVNQVKIQRGLTTSSVAIFVPFISQELFQSGEALYYGLNATSGNMILADRKKNRYVIGKNVYEKHIDDEVHLYGLLHQLAAQAERIRDEEDVFHLLDTVKKYGAIADEMFDGWGIPGRYLVFGEKKDLEGLRERELTKLSDILAEHDAENMSKALEQASWNLPYIIHGSSFRLLVGSIFELLARYCSLKRRILEVRTEKDFLRLQKQTAKEGDTVPRLCRSWGVPKGEEVTAHDVLERAIRNKHLVPVREADLVLVCVEDGSDDAEGFADLEDMDIPDDFDDPDDPGEGWDE